MFNCMDEKGTIYKCRPGPIYRDPPVAEKGSLQLLDEAVSTTVKISATRNELNRYFFASLQLN
jgi:hypothetical protein